MFFHGYNFLYSISFCYNEFKFLSSIFCFIVSGLVPSPSPPFDFHSFRFCSTVSLTVSFSYCTVSAFVLASDGKLSVFLPFFLSSHLYIYWHKPGDSVEVSLHPNFFCALFFHAEWFSWWFFFFPFYVCFCLFCAMVLVVVMLHLLSKSFLLGCWICYCWVI